MLKTNARKITISAVLAALSFVYIAFMPTIIVPAWSFTPFSHLFLVIACFISPYTAAMTYLAVLGGFIFKTGDPLIWLRAGSHIVWMTFLTFYVGKFGLKSKKHIAIAVGITAVLHAGAEILAVLIGLAVGMQLSSLPENMGLTYYILIVVGLGTFGHHCLDYAAGLFVYKAARIERILNNRGIENYENQNRH